MLQINSGQVSESFTLYVNRLVVGTGWRKLGLLRLAGKLPPGVAGEHGDKLLCALNVSGENVHLRIVGVAGLLIAVSVKTPNNSEHELSSVPIMPDSVGSVGRVADGF